MHTLERVNVLGVGVSAITMADALRFVDETISKRMPTYACVSGVHGVMLCQADDALRQIHNRAGMVTPDGMPLVWFGRLSGHRNMRRVCGPDLMLAVCKRSLSADYRHFFLGGAPGTAERLAARLQERFPGLEVVGTFCPPFREMTVQEDAELVEMVEAARPDVLWVGISTPKQERFMANHLGRLSAPLMIGVGAAFDFHAGLKRRAPRWMQESGLEWLFRLASEPRRLWKRYLRNVPLFIVHIALQATGVRDYPMNSSHAEGSKS